MPTSLNGWEWNGWEWFSKIDSNNLSSITALTLYVGFERETCPDRTIWMRRVLGQSMSRVTHVKFEAVRANNCKKCAIGLKSLSCSVPNLRNLRLWVGASPKDDKITMLRHVTVFIAIGKAIPGLKKLETFQHSGSGPRYWIPYLNRRCRARMEVCFTVWPVGLPLMHAISSLDSSVRESRELVDGTDVTHPITSIPDWSEWEEDLEGFAPDIEWDVKWAHVPSKTKSYLGPEIDIFDEPDKYAAPGIGTEITEDDLRGVDLLIDDVDLYSGEYWPPAKFYKRELEIEEGKLQFLLDFFEELKDLGIVKRKNKTTASPATK